MAATAVEFNKGLINMLHTHTHTHTCALVGPRTEERSRTPLSLFLTKAGSKQQSCDSCSHCSLLARGGFANALVCVRVCIRVCVCACVCVCVCVYVCMPQQEDT